VCELTMSIPRSHISKIDSTMKYRSNKQLEPFEDEKTIGHNEPSKKYYKLPGKGSLSERH